MNAHKDPTHRPEISERGSLPILLPRAARWPGPERATARCDRPAVRFLLGFGTQSLRLNHIRFLATTFTAHCAAAAHLIMVSTLPDHLDCSAEGTAFYQFKYLNLAVLRPTSSPSASRGPPRSIHPDRPAMAGAAATADHAGQRFDLIVVGGGAYGLTLAHEAAREGRAVLLLERDRLGGATSANSLRILHGGLRYLQTLNLSRALESIRERAFWLDTFPDLVRPLPCLMPLHGDGLRRPAVLRLALALNERLCRLGDGGRLPRGRVIGPADVLRLCPALAPAGLAGGALWWDAFAPDMARLLEALAGRARAAGAVLLERTPVIGFTRQNGRVAGVVATPSGGPDVVFGAATVVDAAGPWAGRVLARAGIPPPEPWQPLLAWNLVLDRAAPAGEHALAVRARRRGAQTWFLVPAAEGLLAGTGYTPLDHVPDRPPRLADDLRESFLHSLNEAFPALALEERDVIAAPAGILPAAGPGRPWPAERTRIVDHARHGGPAGLVSVVGVKLTVARAAAAAILRMTRRPG